jgi:hypothetical protein
LRDCLSIGTNGLCCAGDGWQADCQAWLIGKPYFSPILSTHYSIGSDAQWPSDIFALWSILI